MEIMIYGEIGTDVKSKEINEKIRDAKGNLVIRINSYGGDVFHAVAIHNAIKARKGVEVRIDGICASAATIIALGGEKIMMPSNARFMIHEPGTLLLGYYDLEKTNKIARGLTSVRDAIKKTYQDRTKMSEEEIELMMKEETWMNAEEAKEKGFIDEIIAPLEGIENSIAAQAVKKERLRVKALESYETESIAAKAIINVAKEQGKTLEEIKPYLDAVSVSKEKPSELEKQIADYLNSGAGGVGGMSILPDEKAQKREEVIAIQQKMRGESR